MPSEQHENLISVWSWDQIKFQTLDLSPCHHYLNSTSHQALEFLWTDLLASFHFVFVNSRKRHISQFRLEGQIQRSRSEPLFSTPLLYAALKSADPAQFWQGEQNMKHLGFQKKLWSGFVSRHGIKTICQRMKIFLGLLTLVKVVRIKPVFLISSIIKPASWER